MDEKITYREILEKFTSQFPTIEVNDYRPWNLPCSIIIWTKGAGHYIYQYSPYFKEGFIIGSNLLPEHK